MVMATKMRLQRMGASKEPRYRIVVINSEAGSSAGYIEKIGNYFPETEDEADEYQVEKDLALEWLQNGAKPSSTVKDILSEEGILEELEEQRAEA
jgi:small subunit ribosomal protein S16